MSPCRTLEGLNGKMCELLHTSAVVQKMQSGQKTPWHWRLFACWDEKAPAIDGWGKLAEGSPAALALNQKSWPHFRPPPVDFCGSRLAIGAAPECARAPASARYARPSVTNATLAASRLLHRRSPTAPCSKGLAAASRLIERASVICTGR